MIYLGLAPSENDKKIKALVDNSYKSLRVVGRGTIVIDPKEVRATESFKRDMQKAKEFFESQNK